MIRASSKSWPGVPGSPHFGLTLHPLSHPAVVPGADRWGRVSAGSLPSVSGWDWSIGSSDRRLEAGGKSSLSWAMAVPVLFSELHLLFLGSYSFPWSLQVQGQKQLLASPFLVGFPVS